MASASGQTDQPITIGILGSGQLGRMIAIAAAQLGLRAHIYAPDANSSPAGDIAYATTTAAYDDGDALATFAQSIDVVTSEFENVPARVMDILGAHCPVSPGQAALHTAQNRIREKTLARELDIDTPRFWHVTTAAELSAAMAALAGPAILKTCEMGYDGKGQARITPDDNADEIFTSLGSDNLILEEMISFDHEVSFLVARDKDGVISHFPPAQNDHRNGILARSMAPAPISSDLVTAGQAAAEKLANAVDLFGVLALESFITADGRLLFNEIAPRPHNSFHWTIEGCATSQFTQLARLLAGLPFGGTHSYGTWQMDNLLGEDMGTVPALTATDGVHIHLYGKAEAKTGRKMGHVTRQLLG